LGVATGGEDAEAREVHIVRNSRTNRSITAATRADDGG